jgi:hypothetical protein
VRVPLSQNVSLCTVVANSEDCLPRFFAWAIPRFADIVLVRSDSDDGTDVLLESAAARWPEQIRLLYRPIDTIARQKQFCIEQANQRWRLVVDADETVEFTDWDKVVALLETRGVDLLALPRYNLQVDDRHYCTQIYPDIQERLLDAHVGFSLEPRYETHHRMQGVKCAGKAGVHILHWGHIRSVEQLKWKSRMRSRYAETDYIEGKQLAENDNWFHVRNTELDAHTAPLPSGPTQVIRRLENAVAAGQLDIMAPSRQ